MELIIRRSTGSIGPMQIFALVVATLWILSSNQPAFAGGEGAFPFHGQDDPRELRLQAFQKYMDGDYEAARHGYKQAIAAAKQAYGPKSTFVADLYYEIGAISLEAGQFQMAEEFLKLAVEHKPCSIVARVRYADVLSMRGKADEAFNQIEQALKKNPHSLIAQQARVKWMMSQASPKNPKGAASNVAATWECYRLHNVGRESVATTLASISNAQKAGSPAADARAENIKTDKSKPLSALAMLRSTPSVPKVETEKPVEKPKDEKAKPEPAAEKAASPVTPLVKHRPKHQPAAEKRVSKPKTRAVEKPAPVKKPVEEPKEEPKETAVAAPHKPKAVVAAAENHRPSKKSKGGLVPPPPPTVPIFQPAFIPTPPPPSNFASVRLDTKAQQLKDAEKEKKKKKPKPQPDVDQEPDFLLDWGSVEGKKKKP